MSSSTLIVEIEYRAAFPMLADELVNVDKSIVEGLASGLCYPLHLKTMDADEPAS